MRKIFISYRRAEAEYAAGALGRALRLRFGDEQVFRDKEDIRGGAKWKQEVLHEIDKDSALLVLIGKAWADSKDAHGKRRLDNPDDPLRLEIADGIKDGAAIIPILLENAQMPRAEELPADLQALADFNALFLRDGDWQYDLDNICRTLEKAGFMPAATERSHPAAAAIAPPDTKPGFGIKGIAGAVIVAFSLVALGSETLDRDAHLGVALFSIVALILGILAWRESAPGRSRGRILGMVVSGGAGLALLAALGGMDSPGAPPPHTETRLDLPPSGAETTAGEAVAAPQDSLAQVRLLKGHAVLRFDPTSWREQEQEPPVTGESVYAHASGDAYVKVISERVEIDPEKLRDFGLAKARQADPKAKVTRRGSRSVNGLTMLVQDIDATVNGMKLTLYAHYYSDASGSIQLVGWTGRSLMAEHRGTIEEFVDGFEVADSR